MFRVCSACGSRYVIDHLEADCRFMRSCRDYVGKLRAAAPGAAEEITYRQVGHVVTNVVKIIDVLCEASIARTAELTAADTALESAFDQFFDYLQRLLRAATMRCLIVARRLAGKVAGFFRARSPREDVDVSCAQAEAVLNALGLTATLDRSDDFAETTRCRSAWPLGAAGVVAAAMLAEVCGSRWASGVLAVCGTVMLLGYALLYFSGSGNRLFKTLMAVDTLSRLEFRREPTGTRERPRDYP
ncbi:MAG: hypothetical protein NC924_02745 [Candidatus Omnitrophica bacterium]|nr:hypothetical protein [Candidatus Omnitrophota bacterium]